MDRYHWIINMKIARHSSYKQRPKFPSYDFHDEVVIFKKRNDKYRPSDLYKMILNELFIRWIGVPLDYLHESHDTLPISNVWSRVNYVNIAIAQNFLLVTKFGTYNIICS